MRTIASLDAKEPELIIGLTSAVGARVDLAVQALAAFLGTVKYPVEYIRLSESLAHSRWPSRQRKHKGTREYQRIMGLMDQGNELRKITGREDVLALLAAGVIAERARTADPFKRRKRAYIVRQLKHHAEVQTLRDIYGDSFWLIGVHASEKERRAALGSSGISGGEVDTLIKRDQAEDIKWGQQVRDTFHLSDVFVSSANVESVKSSLDRFMSLLGGAAVLSPNIDEYGMFLAQAAGLRSADLSRQVGAAILNGDGDVISVGCNEVPKAGGGQYWCTDEYRKRDVELGHDSNRVQILGLLAELHQKWPKSAKSNRKRRPTGNIAELEVALSGSRLVSLTEFGRAVHAEVAAVLAASRVGIPVKGTSLYCTTFPCHNCAKHIVAAGIEHVVYIEPYPKSLAAELHADAVTLEGRPTVADAHQRPLVVLEPFIGVAPSRYATLFSMKTGPDGPLKRKARDGKLVKSKWQVRMHEAATAYSERETAAARILRKLRAESR